MRSGIGGNSEVYLKLINALRTKTFTSVSELSQYFECHLSKIVKAVYTRPSNENKKVLKLFFDIHKDLIFINLQSDEAPKSPLDQWIDVIVIYARYYLKGNPHWLPKSPIGSPRKIPEPLITAFATHVFGCDVSPSMNPRAKSLLSLMLKNIIDTEFLSQTTKVKRGVPQEFIVDENDPYKRSSYWTQKIPMATEEIIRAEYNLPPYTLEIINNSNFTSVLHPQISAILQEFLPMQHFVIEQIMCDQFKRIGRYFTSMKKWDNIHSRIAGIDNVKMIEENGDKENVLEMVGNYSKVSPKNDKLPLEKRSRKRKAPVDTGISKSPKCPTVMKQLRVLLEEIPNASGIKKDFAKPINDYANSYDKNVTFNSLKKSTSAQPQSMISGENWLPYVLVEKLRNVKQALKLSIEDRLDSQMAKILELQPVDQNKPERAAGENVVNRRITRGQKKTKK